MLNLFTLVARYGVYFAGIWPEGADGTDINCAGKSSSQQLLATGDDFGKVHLFPYPCSQPRVSNTKSKIVSL